MNKKLKKELEQLTPAVNKVFKKLQEEDTRAQFQSFTLVKPWEIRQPF